MTLTKIIMPIFINKNDIYLLQNTNNQSSNANIYMYNFIYEKSIIQNNTKQKVLGFQNARLILS